MHTIDSLGLRSGVKLRLHHVNFISVGQVETETTSADGDKDVVDRRVFSESIESLLAGVARHAAVETGIRVLLIVERDFDKVEMGSPGGEDNAMTLLVDQHVL
jgi:hypothetical protein